MGILLSLLMSIPGLAGKFLDVMVQKANVSLEGFKAGANVDLEAYKAHMNAQIEINRMRLAQQSWWGAKLIILMAGVPASMHMASIFLDTIPFPTLSFGAWYVPEFVAHQIGSWRVPKLPPPYDAYESQIVLSFFLVMPAMTGINALAQWLNRK